MSELSKLSDAKMTSASSSTDSSNTNETHALSKNTTTGGPKINKVIAVICDVKGDATLLVGGNMSLRISTRVLSAASPVFSAMFSGPFLEGQNLDSSNPPTIRLPDDSGPDMATICTIAHWKEPYRGEQDAKSLANLLVLADKYQCVSVIKIAFIDKLHNLLYLEHNFIGAYALVRCAYIMRDAESFKRASTRFALALPVLEALFDLSEKHATPAPSFTNQLACLHSYLRDFLDNRTEALRQMVMRRILERLHHLQNIQEDMLLERLLLSEQHFPVSCPLQGTLANMYSMAETADDMPSLQNTILSLIATAGGWDDTPLPEGDFTRYWTGVMHELADTGLCLECVVRGTPPPTYTTHDHTA